MKAITHKIVLFITIAVLAAVCLISCQKYRGYQYDKTNNLYYRFFGTIHEQALMPQEFDFVDVNIKVYTPDTVLIPSTLRELRVGSLYDGDLFDAIQMMHVGDSASFIFEGAVFYEHFVGAHYPYHKDPVYVDIKLHKCTTSEQKKLEVQRQWQERKMKESETIRHYLSANHLTIRPSADGIYYRQLSKGNGQSVQSHDSVWIAYTMKFLDDSIFDGSSRYGKVIQYRVGEGKTIPAWNKALLMMHEGETAVFLIPSSMAYAEKGKGNGVRYIVPPYTPILLEMEVKKIVR